MDSFTFNPVEGFLNTDSYPDPASCTAARTQLQSLHSQTQTFINEQIVSAINTAQNDIATLKGNMTTAQGDISSLQSSLSSLSTALEALSDSVTALNTTFTTNELKIVVDGTTYKISVQSGSVVPIEV
jgi:peptidoglycan hydrolase CwlO-like protein